MRRSKSKYFKKINIKDFKKIKENFYNLFKKKKKKEDPSTLLLSKLQNKNIGKCKKRKSINIKFWNFKIFSFFKKNYIPYLLILSSIFIISIVFLILWPIFKIKFVEIIKKDNITNMDISYKSVESFRWKSIFKVTKSDLLKKFTNYQENIKDISLNINLPNTLEIEVESYKEIFNVTINEKSYIIVENGTLIPSKAYKDLNNIVIKKDIDKNKFIEYKKIFNPYYLSKITDILSKLNENLLSIKVESIIYYENERELHLLLESGTRLIFSLDSDIDINEQVEKLAIFNDEQISIVESWIIYIDLRIKNKIFYCPEEEAYVCNLNIKSIYAE